VNYSAVMSPDEMSYSANVSGMAVSSTEDELSEDGGDNVRPNRKHIVYQSCLLELVKQVCYTSKSAL